MIFLSGDRAQRLVGSGVSGTPETWEEQPPVCAGAQSSALKVLTGRSSIAMEVVPPGNDCCSLPLNISVRIVGKSSNSTGHFA